MGIRDTIQAITGGRQSVTNNANTEDGPLSDRELRYYTGESRISEIQNRINYNSLLKIIIGLIVLGVVFYFIISEQYIGAMITAVAGLMFYLFGLDVAAQALGVSAEQQRLKQMKNAIGVE